GDGATRGPAANPVRPRSRYVSAPRPRVIPLGRAASRKRAHAKGRGARLDVLRLAPLRGRNASRRRIGAFGSKSEGHRHKKAVDAGLTGRAVVLVEDPVVAILGGQGPVDGNLADVAI